MSKLASSALHWRKRLRQKGLSIEWYEKTLVAQGGCSKCGAVSPGGRFLRFAPFRGPDGKFSELVCGFCCQSLSRRTNSVHREIDGVKQKRCPSCKEWKTVEDHYYPNPLPGRPNHTTSRCKECDYKRRHTPEGLARVRAASRKKQLKQYGLTPEAYRQLIGQQDGRCAICGKRESKLQVDHDHATGKVRGLLCRSCNVALGHLDDSPLTCRQAAYYLELHSYTQ